VSFLSVCSPGVMTLVYCNMLVPFPCLKSFLLFYVFFYSQVSYSISLLDRLVSDAIIIVGLRLVLTCKNGNIGQCSA
jgi:hypothetical protein